MMLGLPLAHQWCSIDHLNSITTIVIMIIIIIIIIVIIIIISTNTNTTAIITCASAAGHHTYTLQRWHPSTQEHDMLLHARRAAQVEQREGNEVAGHNGAIRGRINRLVVVNE
jgi:hypothetical protein